MKLGLVVRVCETRQVCEEGISLLFVCMAWKACGKQVCEIHTTRQVCKARTVSETDVTFHSQVYATTTRIEVSYSLYKPAAMTYWLALQKVTDPATYLCGTQNVQVTFIRPGDI